MIQSIRVGSEWEGQWGTLRVACEISFDERTAEPSRQSRGLKPYFTDHSDNKSLPALGSGVRMLPRREDK